jgi:hypothetical protein
MQVVPHYMLTVAFIIVTLVRASEVRSRCDKRQGILRRLQRHADAC